MTFPASVVSVLIIVQFSIAGNLHEWETLTYMNNITDVEYFQGDIWVSTTGGAYRFNISDSLSTKYTNVDGLTSLDLTCIARDNRGNVYFGSKDGIINVFSSSTKDWTSYHSMEGQEISDIFANDDSLWVASNDGLGVFFISNAKLEYREFYNNFPVEVQTSHKIKVFNNRVFFATTNGLLHATSDFIKHNLLIESAWQVLTTADGLPANDIRDISICNDSLFVATTAGAVKLDKSLNINSFSGWTLGYVNKIISTDQKIFFVKDREFYEEVDNQWQLVNNYAKTITCVTSDDSGSLWFGFADGGLRHSEWTKPFLIDGPASNHVGNLTLDQNGNIWIASGTHHLPSGQGFYKYDFNTWRNFKFSDNNWNRINGTVNVYNDKSGNIWFGTWGGGMLMLSYSDSGLLFYHGWLGDGRMIISTVQGEEEIALTEVPTDMQDCLAGANVSATYYTVISNFIEDGAGNLWFANYLADRPEYIGVIPFSQDGSLITDCSEWTFFGDEINMSLTEGEIGPMEFDDYGRLWFGTFREGLLIIDYNNTIDNKVDDSVMRKSTADNLFSNNVLSLRKDHDGVMWIGTTGGLNSWDGGENFNKHLGDEGELGPVESKINHIVVDKYNNKWFSTDGGLSILKSGMSPWYRNAWIHFTPDNSGLPSKIVNCVYADDQSGASYIGTEQGLSIYRGSYSEYRPDLDSTVGGPNPFVPDGSLVYTIKNLMPDVKIKILSINGHVIRVLSKEDNSVQGSRAYWNGKDEKNKMVSSGIYLYLIYNNEGVTGRGKISVIRP